MADWDLTRVLADWPFEPGDLCVREIAGADGKVKIQVRVQLGILQMEENGRPDGQRPEGFESLLAWHTERLRAAGEAGLTLSPDECAALRAEAAQYYHRYMAFFALERYADVVRDASRNIAVLDVCRRHAAEETDREALEHVRSSVLALRARAEAAHLIRAGHSRAAVAAIDRGIQEVRTAYAARGMSDRFETSGEVAVLRALREMLVPKLPSSQRLELEERLRAAIAAENFELAAILRDELRLME